MGGGGWGGCCRGEPDPGGGEGTAQETPHNRVGSAAPVEAEAGASWSQAPLVAWRALPPPLGEHLGGGRPLSGARAHRGRGCPARAEPLLWLLAVLSRGPQELPHPPQRATPPRGQQVCTAPALSGGGGDPAEPELKQGPAQAEGRGLKEPGTHDGPQGHRPHELPLGTRELAQGIFTPGH